MIPTIFPKYNEVVEAVQIMSFGIISGTIGMIYTSKFLSLEKSKFVLISTLIALGTVVISIIILGPIFGTVGIAISYLLATTISTSFLVGIDKLIKL